jgi:hypothetical protein
MPSRPPRVRALRLLVALLVLFGAGATGTRADGPSDDLRNAKRAWQRVARETDLGLRTAALHDLAALRTPQALDFLLEIYERPGPYPEHLRETLAPIIAHAFGGRAHVRTFLTVLRGRLAAPEDAWLAWQVFGRWVGSDLERHVRLAARAFVDQPYHRAAALDTLSRDPVAQNLEVARTLLATLPDEEPARTLLAESASALWIAGLRPRRDALRVVDLEPVLGVLETEGVADRTRRTIARQLATLLDSHGAWLDAGSWRRALQEARAAEKLRRDGYAPTTTSTPTFLGIPARGRDVCYVIDVSGSMNMPTTGAVRERARTPRRPRGPATGVPTPEREPVGEGDENDVWRGLEDLPWHRIGTRLDLVKEALKASLEGLQADQHFAIVSFSNAARELSLTRRPLRATRDNVARACRAVDALSAGGGTNLHRGLELAFAFDDQGVEDDDAFVDPRHLLRGFDTIFLLTDGSPNVDSYGSKGLDPRSGANVFYAATDNIVRSARRQNLFRHMEIHCIGMGSSPRSLLEDLAAVGGGEARFLGR